MLKTSTKIKLSTYENIIVDCPYCRNECIFNRISDLKIIMPIAGRDLKCDDCKRNFWVSGDLIISAKYRWFLDDLHLLRKNKNYGLYILVLCQALEIFTHQALINKLIDKNTDY